ncbi:MAG: OmpW family protein [Rickettsiales endosymbiont of Dermacentor nuttalli]
MITKELGSVPANFSSSLKTKSFPVTLMLQYHTPTFGFLQPYVGTGYSYSFFKNKNTYIVYNGSTIDSTFRIKPKNTGTAVVQVDSNFDLRQNLGVNFDVKYSWLKPKYKVSYTNAVDTTKSYSKTHKVKVNPVTVTLGLTYKF